MIVYAAAAVNGCNAGKAMAFGSHANLLLQQELVCRHVVQGL
jgi:hypothetical protein